MANELRALRPSVYTAILFFFYAIIVIPVGKYLLARYPVPGLSQLAAAI
jgi:hypothetical protein